MSSGLGTLPLDHVWLDGNENTSWPTNKTLPLGGVLNGKKAYEMIMPYYTTNEMTPDQVHNLGYDQLNIFYPQVRIMRSFLMTQMQYIAPKPTFGRTLSL